MIKRYRVTIEDETFEVAVETLPSESLPVAPRVSGSKASASRPAAPAPKAAAPAPKAAAPAPKAAAPAPKATSGAGTTVAAPMPGLILSINVKEGQEIKSGDQLFVLEAMKMENEIFAPCDGTVTSINVASGQSVNVNDVLCVIG